MAGGTVKKLLLMILGLLGLVLAKGLPTFWPAQVVRITTLDGREVMGEVDTSERYRPEPQLLERLPEPDGRILYRLRHRWRDGTTHVLLDPLELVEKLAALAKVGDVEGIKKGLQQLRHRGHEVIVLP